MVSFSKAVQRLVGTRSGRIAQLWEYQTTSTFIAPSIVEDINSDGQQEIILATKDGQIIVLNDEGQELWTYNVQEQVGAVEEMFLDQEVMNSINSSPTIKKQKERTIICFGTELGMVYCLDHKGQELWKFQAKGGIRGSILIEDVNNDGEDEIVFGSLDKNIYILTKDGQLIEQFEQDSPVESTPGYQAGAIIFGTNEGKIISITAQGKINWEHQTGSQVSSQPSFGTLTQQNIDVVIIGSTDNTLYCFDIDGELMWSYETKGAIYSKAVIDDLNKDGNKEIIIGSCDNNVHVITHEGDKLWSYETDFWVVGAPIIHDIDQDGNLEVIAGSYDHNVYVLDGEGAYELDYMPGLSGIVQQTGHYTDILTSEPGSRIGKKLWQYKTPGPIIGCHMKNNELIVTTKKGIIASLHHKKE